MAIRRFLGVGVGLVVFLATSSSALASPVTIDFESGASVGDQITNQYAAPGGVPEGPTFMAASSAGFTPFGCGPGHLTNAYAHSPINSVVLDGCTSGSEFNPTGTFFSMGYTTDAVSFWIAIGGGIISGAHDTVVTTAFDANHAQVEQVVTTLGPQSGPTWQQVSLSSASGNIAFVAVELGSPGTNSSSPTGVTDTVVDLNSTPLYLDDLTYDPPATPPSSSFVLGANPAGTSTVQGGQATISIPVTWINNPNPSADPVSLAASTPTGVTASFSPNPTSTGGATLTLDVDKAAPIGQTSVTVTGSSGGKMAQVVIPFGISAAFQIVDPGTVTVAPCTPRQVQLRVNTAITDPITIGVVTVNQPGVAIAGISGGQVTSPGQATTTVTPQQGVATATLTLDVPPGTPPAAAQAIGVSADASGYTGQFNDSGRLAVGPGTVTSVLPTVAKAPQALQPGTEVTITGPGFCPDSRVQFGNAAAVAKPDSINSSGTTLRVAVPRLATTGPVTVLSGSPPVAGSPSAQSVTIDDYRNTNGFAFHNYAPTGFDINELADLFGTSQVFFSVNPCWPFDCSIPLFPTPTAGILLGVADASLASGGSAGACFGFSLSSQRILSGQKSLAYFQPQDDTIFSIDTPAGPSPTTLRYINTQALAQFSRQFLDRYLNAQLTAASTSPAGADAIVHQQVTSTLAAGRFPLIAVHDSATGAGHVVIGYDLEDVGPDDFYIDVYDSNDPFQTGENTDPAQTRALASRIHVTGGNWSLPSSGFSGDQGGIFVTDPNVVPVQPAMADSLPGSFFYFGSAGAGGSSTPPSRTTQLTDAAGHTLFDAAGKLNGNPRTRFEAAPFAPAVAARAAASPTARSDMFVIGGKETSFRQTVVGTGAGPDAHTLLGSGFIGQIDTRATRGVKDDLTLRPGAGAIGLTTDASRVPLTLTTMGAVRGGWHTVQVTTTSFRGGGDSLTLDHGGNGATFVHKGSATTVSVTLSAIARNSMPASFQSRPLRVGRGQSVQITGARWQDLAGSTLRIRIGGRTFTVANRLRVGRLAAIAALSAKRTRGGQYTLSIRGQLKKLPRTAHVAFMWVVRRGRRAVGTHALVLERSGGTIVRTWAFKPPRPGRYTFTASVVVVTIHGALASSSRTSRSVAFKGG